MQHVSLCTLNLLAWPKEYKVDQWPEYYATVACKLLRLATDILHICRHKYYSPQVSPRRFEIVAFGLRDIRRELYYAIPKYFVEGEVRGLRYAKTVAVPATLRALEEEGLETDILHYDWRQFDKECRGDGKRSYIDDEEHLGTL